MPTDCKDPKGTIKDNKPTRYEAPELTVVGEAATVILGLPGCGWDGPDGMSECQFEFESDDNQT
jgi:hypothetical protein